MLYEYDEWLKVFDLCLTSSSFSASSASLLKKSSSSSDLNTNTTALCAVYTGDGLYLCLSSSLRLLRLITDALWCTLAAQMKLNDHPSSHTHTHLFPLRDVRTAAGLLDTSAGDRTFTGPSSSSPPSRSPNTSSIEPERRRKHHSSHNNQTQERNTHTSWTELTSETLLLLWSLKKRKMRYILYYYITISLLLLYIKPQNHITWPRTV